LRGKEGPETLILPSWHDQQGGSSGEMAARHAAWSDLSKAEATVFPGQAKENRRGSENFSGKGSSDSVEAGHQDAPVAQVRFPKFGLGPVLVPVVS
jgi:hypothetical protein